MRTETRFTRIVYPLTMRNGISIVAGLVIFPLSAQAAPDALLLLESGPGVCAATRMDREGFVATAYHCVNHRRTLHLRDAEGVREKATLHAARRDLDLAILRVEEFSDWSGLTLRLDPLSPGEEVEVFGHPFYSASQEIAVLEGLLAFSGFRGSVSAVGPFLNQLDVAFNPGISGGPVVDESGRLAGVASRKLKGEHLSFAASSAPLAGMLDAPKIPRLSGRLAVWSDLDLPLRAGGVPSFHLTPQLTLWDWIGMEGSLGWEMGANWAALTRGEAKWTAWRGGTFLRLRGGVGASSVVLDLGGRVAGGMRLEGSVQDEQAQFLRQAGPVAFGPSARLSWRGWSLGGQLLQEEGSWVPALSLGVLLSPKFILF